MIFGAISELWKQLISRGGGGDLSPPHGTARVNIAVEFYCLSTYYISRAVSDKNGMEME